MKPSTGWAWSWVTLGLNKCLALLLSTGLAVLMQACASTSPRQAPDSNTSAPPRVLEVWSTSGKASLSGPEGTDTVNLTWHRENPAYDRVQLAGPLGFGALELVRRGNEVTWIDDGQELPLAQLPLTSTARKAVAQLPLDQVGDWMLGYMPTAGPWQVRITQWQAYDDWRVPRKMILEHGKFKIRMVLLEWDLGKQT